MPRCGGVDRAFEDRITSTPADAEDPLAVWLEYVAWAKQNYLSTTGENPLLSLLERATRQFKDTERYRNDSRYVKLWIAYVRVRRPTAHRRWRILACPNMYALQYLFCN